MRVSSILTRPWGRLLGAASAGVALTAAFPSIGLDSLVWVALVPLLAAVKGTRPGQGLRLGLACGLVHYLSLLVWVVYTMTTYGRLPLWLCVPVWFLLSFFLALFTGLFGMGMARLGHSPALRALIGPALWTGLEFARTHVFTGFPWALLGASQYERLPIIQMVEITGTYGLSFLIVLGNVIVFEALTGLAGQGRAAKLRAAALAAGWTGLVAGLWLWGLERIATIDALGVKSPQRRIAVLQGNIDQDQKWDPQFQNATLAVYGRLSRQAAGQGAELIVWPETAAPFYFGYQAEPTALVMETIVGLGIDTIVGGPWLLRRHGEASFFNSAFLVDGKGVLRDKYDKVHLVPFGEYVPLKRFLPFLGKMVEQVGDFSPGPPGRTLAWQDQQLGILICYEVIFPGLARAMVANGAGILINMTNDAWFGRSGAPLQHFSTAVMRAVENRRSLARAANTGISGFIDPAGRMVSATNLFEQTCLTRTLPVLDVSSPYRRWGNWFAWVCVAAVVGAGILGRHNRPAAN